jgi:DNA-binding protein YbaB
MWKDAKSAGSKVGDQVMAKEDFEVLKDLSVAAGNLYDGAVDDKGEPIDMGLKRDELPDTNRKQFDAGKVRFAGDKAIVTYEAEITLKDVHKNGINGFQNEMDEMIQKVVNQLKKNYRAVSGKTITLTAEGDGAKVNVEYVSRYRTLVHAVRPYKIGGLTDVVAATGAEVNKREMAETYKKFLEQGGFGKRPKNDTRPKND